MLYYFFFFLGLFNNNMMVLNLDFFVYWYNEKLFILCIIKLYVINILLSVLYKNYVIVES